ncbi:NAD(P)/FAD-dependent oxidoreductase [Poriferisphaera sp. WC338]|uniref:NAD(P)/FAD-dependent oxidoreductase n=1 Tax=Poriferisphaera sp. WC338 TaxID=3425129 RepID=UPI003D8183B0
MNENHYNITIIGAGAAGLFAAIHAADAAPHLNIALLDSAKSPGTKILVSGGGRCNVTNKSVTPKDYNAPSTNAVKKILKSFTVKQTINIFDQLGVKLKTEPTGKLFPTSDSARTVLDALLREVNRLPNLTLLANHRVTSISRLDGNAMFRISTIQKPITTERIILCSGGKSLPKSGSDGFGYELAKSLGHTVTPTSPALVPLTYHDPSHYLTKLTGIAIDTPLTLSPQNGKPRSFPIKSLLFTHFGISGPAAMDLSRHFLILAQNTPDQSPTLTANLLAADHPDLANFDALEQHLLSIAQSSPKRAISSHLKHLLPSNRLAEILLDKHLGIPHDTKLTHLTRDDRRALAHTLLALDLPIHTHRGWNYAEVTAGGIPLTELHLNTMESRINPDLYLAGEILDVDGRIGGFNFQFAWNTGRLAGLAAANSFNNL